MKIIYLKILNVIFILITLTSQSQKVFKDAGMWNTLSFKHKINKKLALLFTEEFRLKENFTQVNLTYSEFGLEYTYNKNVKTSIVYRAIQKFQYDNPLSYRNRMQWDIGLKKNIGKFGINYRHRLQGEVKDYYTSENGQKKKEKNDRCYATQLAGRNSQSGSQKKKRSCQPGPPTALHIMPDNYHRPSTLPFTME